MFDRWVEPELLTALEQAQIGAVVFSPLAKGLLTNRYFDGVPTDSRASRDPRFLRAADITPTVIARAKQLNEVAASRGQTLAQLALAWVLRHPIVTSALIGASRVSQLDECAATTRNLAFAAEELALIDRILAV
jgi:L-glyceraldehyde 3-phosphate reductase